MNFTILLHFLYGIDVYLAMSIEFIETAEFTKKVIHYIDDAEFHDFQLYLMLNPNAGDLIPGSGGLRKVRWAGKGKGKRGGFRVIHFRRMMKGEIWLLDIYAKNEIENISLEKLKILHKEVPND